MVLECLRYLHEEETIGEGGISTYLGRKAARVCATLQQPAPRIRVRIIPSSCNSSSQVSKTVSELDTIGHEMDVLNEKSSFVTLS